MKKMIVFVLFVAHSITLAAWDKEIHIPYSKFTLKNGLRLIVHEDHKTPQVSINVWYHVGSKNEPTGKSGFAHLFEHLMFNGSEHFNDDYFKAMEKVGATNLNGTTNQDRTNYFETVPTTALDFALWMESDRMGHLLGAIDQKKLDEQRGVVQNEKRQNENQPYGLVNEKITRATYPAEHPYSWTVIGSMEDLNRATLADVHEWFKAYYGPANAVVVVAGDVNPQDVFQKVTHYFGSFPPGPPVHRFKSWIAKRTQSQREVMYDRVPHAKFYKVWNIPEVGHPDLDALDLVSDILSSGKTSRLHRKLVEEEQLCFGVSAYISPNEIGSQFIIEATAKQGVDLSKIEKRIQEELNLFFKKGAESKELKRIKAQYYARAVKGLEKNGGYNGKSEILAHNEVFFNNPDQYKTTLKRVETMDNQTLKAAARKWLTQGEYHLDVLPYNFPSMPEPSTVDRKKLPLPKTFPPATFPSMRKTQLDNGLKLIVVEQPSVPFVEMSLQFPFGYALTADKPGLADLTFSMLNEGTRHYSGDELSETLSQMGSTLSASVGMDTSNVRMSTLKTNLKPSFDIFADVLLNPTFPQTAFDREKKLQLENIQSQKADPKGIAFRVVPNMIYETGHPYRQPQSGGGTSESVTRIQRKDLEQLHQTYFSPQNATLIVVGDTTLETIQALTQSYFKKWKTPAKPLTKVPSIKPLPKSKLYVVDRADAVQSLIFGVGIVPPKDAPGELEFMTALEVLSNDFTSRINMNLREDKHWSYGAYSSVAGSAVERPLYFYTHVQTDQTLPAWVEMKNEMDQILKTKPITEQEFKTHQNKQILEMIGAFETMGAITKAIETLERYKLPDTYYEDQNKKLSTLTLQATQLELSKTLKPQNLQWLIVGNYSKIKHDLDKLNIPYELITNIE